MKRVLVLVGPKGAGKSTIGAVIERELGVPFVRVEPVFLAVLEALGRLTPMANGEASRRCWPASGANCPSRRPSASSPRARHNTSAGCWTNSGGRLWFSRFRFLPTARNASIASTNGMPASTSPSVMIRCRASTPLPRRSSCRGPVESITEGPFCQMASSRRFETRFGIRAGRAAALVSRGFGRPGSSEHGRCGAVRGGTGPSPLDGEPQGGGAYGPWGRRRRGVPSSGGSGCARRGRRWAPCPCWCRMAGNSA